MFYYPEFASGYLPDLFDRVVSQLKADFSELPTDVQMVSGDRQAQWVLTDSHDCVQLELRQVAQLPGLSNRLAPGFVIQAYHEHFIDADSIEANMPYYQVYFCIETMPRGFQPPPEAIVVDSLVRLEESLVTRLRRLIDGGWRDLLAE